MADPLTALMYAVQVMNFLKTLIIRTLREREDSVVESSPRSKLEPSSDGNRHQSPLQSLQEDSSPEYQEAQETLMSEITVSEILTHPDSLQNDNLIGGESGDLITSENPVCEEDLYCEYPPKGDVWKSKTGQSSNSHFKKVQRKTKSQQPTIKGTGAVEKEAQMQRSIK